MSIGFELDVKQSVPLVAGGRADDQSAAYNILPVEEGLVAYSMHGLPIAVVLSLSSLIPGPNEKKLILPGLSPYYQYTLPAKTVLVLAKNAKAADAWEKRVEEAIALMPGLSLVGRWRIGLDTGISSMTMVNAVFGEEYQDIEAYRSRGTPSDAADFGRCMRAVDHFTSAMAVMDSGIRDKFLNPCRYSERDGKAWPLILEGWEELCDLARKGGLSSRKGPYVKTWTDVLDEKLKQIHDSVLPCHESQDQG